MDRKTFLKTGLFSLAAGSTLSASETQSSFPSVVGFNHLPPDSPEKIMDNLILHKANTRGHANHGWLDTHHTFSFASYYNPERMQFGVLRVLNDDIVQGGMGFGTHPHDNMEIISLPLQGDLEHKDSMGNVQVIRQHDIQVMSAGTGIYHSEFNRNPDQAVNFLQIWILPNKKGVSPRYDQMSFKPEDRHNRLQQILSPDPSDDGVWIHQDAWFHLGKFEIGKEVTYQSKKHGNGVYIFVLSGKLTVNGQELETRDGLGIPTPKTIALNMTAASEFLIMDVPLS